MLGIEIFKFLSLRFLLEILTFFIRKLSQKTDKLSSDFDIGVRDEGLK